MNPLKEALAILLRPNGNGRVQNDSGQNLDLGIYDYSDRNDFRKLWMIGEESRACLTESCIIIVWSRTADDEQMSEKANSSPTSGDRGSKTDSRVTLKGILTPVDCVIAYSSRPQEHVPNVLVLETGGQLQTPKPLSVEHFDSLKSEELPWLRIERDISLPKIVQWLDEMRSAQERRLGQAETQNIEKKHLERNSKAIERFRRVIQSNLTNEPAGADYDHHSIANIIGPMVLLGEPPTPSLHAKALLELLRACKLAPKPKSKPSTVPREGKEPHSPQPSVPQDSWRLPEGVNLDDVELILVDDQADEGWRQWIQRTLKPVEERNIYRNPGDLIDLIENQFEQTDREKTGQSAVSAGDNAVNAPTQPPRPNDLRFRLNFPGVAPNKIPILLLDLRLFAGERQAERDFYANKLLPLIDARFSKATNPKWEPAWEDKAWVGSEIFESYRAAVTADSFTQATDDHRAALTWLPRLLALTDMSLPIVLFSSTDRKSLIEPLLPYRNIFISFHKPSLQTLNILLVRETAATLLQSTVNEAIVFGQMRQKCQQIFDLVAKVEPELSGPKAETLHVELYLDETGRENQVRFAVGGIFAVFANAIEADAFEDDCVRNGLRYFHDDFFEPRSPNSPLRKRGRDSSDPGDSGIEQLTTALRSFATAGHQAPSFGFVRIGRTLLPEDAPHSADQRDAWHHQMVSALIEAFCAESIPAILRHHGLRQELIVDGKFTFAVYVATRMVPPPKEDTDLTFRECFEVHPLKRDRGLRTIAARDAFPIVRNALLRIPRRAPLLNCLRRAIALSLRYANSHTNELDQVVNPNLKLVRYFDPKWDAATVPLPSRGVYGEVRTAEDHYIFVQVFGHGPGEDIYCPKTCCRGAFAAFTPGTTVRLDVEESWKRQGKYVGTNVSIVTPQAAERWCDEHTRELSQSFLRNTDQLDWRPDYRALHYIADQILLDGALEEFMRSIPTTAPGQFNGFWDEDCRNCIESGRALDRDHLSDALRLYPNAVDSKRLGAYRPAAVWLAARLAEKLKTCKGDVL